MNERLHSVLAQRGVSPESLADACGVDPKTVSRWLGGRVPHPRHRFSVAQHLRVEEEFLWPRPPGRPGQVLATDNEIIATYANRASVPRELWLSLLQDAVKQIDVLVFSGTFFAQTNPHVTQMLAARASCGVRVRMCFGDPNGRAVATRDREERLGETLSAKIRASLTYYRTLVSEPGCEIRLHDTTLYSSVFRYDNDLLVNFHVWGQPASANPTVHLRRLDASGWFDNYARSFNEVWAIAQPWIPGLEVNTTHGQD